MNGKFAWMIGAALTASALVLGGCVADTDDEDDAPTAQAGTALVIQPELPKEQGGAQPDPGSTPPVPSSVAPPGSGENGTPNGDPEPSPWDTWRPAH